MQYNILKQQRVSIAVITDKLLYCNKLEIMKGNGIGFLGLLTIVFIVLKLTSYISWSWWLVLLPLYGGVAVIISILVIIFVVGLAQDYFKK